VDANGCGLDLPGIGEFLLALESSPELVASGPLAGGVSDLPLPIPNVSGLAGLTVYLQGIAVDTSIAQSIELTNALSVKLGP